MRTLWQRLRSRQAAKAAARRPDLSWVGPDLPPPRVHDPAPRTDWPAIESRHPGWWLVQRVERHDDGVHLVLIAECRTEDEAFTVANRQASQVRISKWGSRLPPYYSPREPKEVP
jgi:hypothetical protein